MSYYEVSLGKQAKFAQTLAKFIDCIVAKPTKGLKIQHMPYFNSLLI